MTGEQRRIVDAFWDLRDDAYDHPGRWHEVTPEVIFQRLSEIVQDAEDRGDPIDWAVVAQRMIAWRENEG